MSGQPKLRWECSKCRSKITYPRDAYCGCCLTVIDWDSALKSTKTKLLECAKQEDSPIYRGDSEIDNFVRLSEALEIIDNLLISRN